MSNNLKRAREIQGMSQRELATAIGQDPAQLSRLETGQVGNTPAGIRLKVEVARVLRVRPEWIFPELEGKK